MNIDLGAFDGNAIQWDMHRVHAVINFAIWILLQLLVFAILYFFKRHAKSIIIFVSCAVIFMQSSALAVSMLTSEKADYTLSGEGEYELGGDGNVIVFVLDAFSTKLMNDICKADEHALDAYADFTRFTNCNTGYVGTFPGMMYLMTGYRYRYDISYEENFQLAWSDDRTRSFMQDIKNAGYQTRLYSASPNYIFGKDLSRAVSYFSNVQIGSRASLNEKTVKQFIGLSLFRYVPHIMKASFWMYSGDITFTENYNRVESNHEFIENYRTDRLTVRSGSKYVTWYLLTGAHVPYKVDQLGNYIVEGTDSITQARGYLRVLTEYISEMKEYGLYDDATIIITADHGDKRNTQSLLLIKEPNAKNNEIVNNNSPVSHEDILSTILRCLSLPYEQYGKSIFDYTEDDIRERSVILLNHRDDYPETNGKYNVMDEYIYTGDDDTGKKTIRKGECVIHPLFDSFY